MSVYVSIGNSDDNLTQAEWAMYQAAVTRAIFAASSQMHGQWVSHATHRWQNAAWCFDIDDEPAMRLQRRLAELAWRYRQDSIAWADAETEFIPPAEPTL